MTLSHETEQLFTECVDWVCAQGLSDVYFSGGAAFHLWKRTATRYATLLQHVPWRDFDVLCTTELAFHSLSSRTRPPSVDAVLDISYWDTPVHMQMDDVVHVTGVSVPCLMPGMVSYAELQFRPAHIDDGEWTEKQFIRTARHILYRGTGLQ